MCAALLGCGDTGNGADVANDSNTAQLQTATDATADGGPAVTPDESSDDDAADAESLPQVELADLKTIVDEAAAADQVLVMDFWATWCIPCREMFGPLHDQLGELGSGVRLISVTLDTPGETEERAIEFLREHHALKDAYMITTNADGRVAIAEGLGDRWYNMVVPVVLIFGPDGKLQGEFLDAEAAVEPIVARVTELVEAGK